MGDLVDLRRRGVDISEAMHRELIQAQTKVVEEIQKAWFFQCVHVEYYDNGMLKCIHRDVSVKAIISFGVVVVVCGVAVYFVGPDNVVNAAKEMLKLYGKLPKLAITTGSM